MPQTWLLDILVLACIFCFGVRGVVDKRALEKVPYKALLMAVYSVYLPSAVVCWCLLSRSPAQAIGPDVILWSACSAIGQFAAVLFYLLAMSWLEASFVIGITAAYPLVMQVLAVPTLGESILGPRLIGAILMGIGIFSISRSNGAATGTVAGAKRSIALACVCLCTLLWGVIGIFDKKAVCGSSPLAVYYIKCVCNVVLALMSVAWLYFRHELPRFKSAVLWRYSGISASLMTIGNVAYVQALALAPASYVIVVTGCYPVVMYIGALWILKERLSMARLSGVCTIVLGAILTQLTRG